MEQSPTHAWGPHDGPMRPARLSVGIISAGRVGTALGVALERADHVVVACSAISHASRQRAQRRLPDTAVLPVHEVAGRAELLLLAVPDAELATVVTGLGRHARGATGHDRGAHLGRQRHRGAEPADRTGLHPAGDPPGDDLHRCRRGHRPAARHLLRHHRRRRRRLRHRAVAGARDRRRAVPGPRGRPHAVSRGPRACQQSHRDRGARRRRGAAGRPVGSGAARPGARRRRTRAASPSGWSVRWRVRRWRTRCSGDRRH